MKIYSWKTKKTDKGFEYTVTANTPRTTPNAKGRYMDTETVKTGTLPTRARTKAKAQKWCSYLRTTS
ncbi:MAG: hypothetical protein KAJ10_10145 [Thermodesulfovibrionia bacterium]|nr:hypothetical protein [Thermodesulfovibrionia bacterium]